MNHDKRGEYDITLGIGDKNSPQSIKKLNEDYYLNEGEHPFPSNKIALDITEFIPYMNNDSSNTFHFMVEDTRSTTTGEITDFSIETYSDYSSEDIDFTYISDDLPVSTIHDDSVYSIIVNGPAWTVTSEYNYISIEADENCEATLQDHRGDVSAINNVKQMWVSHKAYQYGNYSFRHS
ncbi:MAG: hypothetical protein ACOCQ4_01865 [bacterium]